MKKEPYNTNFIKCLLYSILDRKFMLFLLALQLCTTIYMQQLARSPLTKHVWNENYQRIVHERKQSDRDELKFKK